VVVGWYKRWVGAIKWYFQMFGFGGSVDTMVRNDGEWEVVGIYYVNVLIYLMNLGLMIDEKATLISFIFTARNVYLYLDYQSYLFGNTQ